MDSVVRKLYLVLASCAYLADAAQRPVVKYLGVPVPMRDGVRLFANVFLPNETSRLPAILVRTPYGKGADITPNYQAFVEHGYAIVVQDVRGRYESEGAFQPFTQETGDGDDTLNWVARQPWSNGKVGMMGGSYVGIAQWKAASTNNPHLKAISPVVSGYDDYRDRYYSTGGALKLGNRLEWMSENLRAPGYHQDFGKFVLHLPVRSSDVAALGWTSPMYQDIIEHPSFDAFWRAISTKEHLDRIKVPVFSVGGWYDNFVQSDLEAYAARRRTSALSRILVGPWAHNMSVPFEGVDFGTDATVAVRALQLQWFDQFLMGKDVPLLSQPPVRIFVMGANKWREETAWPPEYGAILKAGLTHRRSVDNGHHLLEVINYQTIEKDFVAILEIRQVYIFFDRILFAPQGSEGALDLLIQRKYPWRQQASQAQHIPLTLGEGGPFIEQWVGQQLPPMEVTGLTPGGEAG